MPDLYAAALRTLLDVNVVGSGSKKRVIRAGGGYPTPWTRDAAINCWYAGSLLVPDVARQTLLSVCERAGDVQLLAQDNQWWDQIVWAVAAWHHYEVTGDLEFLAAAYPIARDSAALLESRHLDRRWGLYRGPAVMQDGISGYPVPPADPAIDSSFVLDHPDAASIMCLSTNTVYVGAYQAMARMATVLGAEARPHLEAAKTLTAAVNRHLWREEAGTYGYFLHGPGPNYGELDTHAEAIGLALAVLFDVADRRRQDLIYASAPRQPWGVVNVWPAFPRYDTGHPGRHNVICWPMVMGVWADAAAHAGRSETFATGIGDMVRLFTKSDDVFYELYNATTGDVDGGWQQGRQWESQPDQTWSATTFLGLVHHRLIGLRCGADGLGFDPIIPPGWDPLIWSGLRYRAASFDVTVTGCGQGLRALRLDGETLATAVVPSSLRGHHEIHLDVAPQ